MAYFIQLAQLADALASTSSRIKKRTAMAQTFAAIAHREDAGQVGLLAQYLAGQVFAASYARKVHAGGAMLRSLVMELTGATEEAMAAAYRRYGDLGAATHDLYVAAKRSPQPVLTLQAVQQAFFLAAEARTVMARRKSLQHILSMATPLEAQYLLKLLSGDMRIGVKQSLVEEAMAEAAQVTADAVRYAVMLEADLVVVAVRAFSGTLAQAQMRLFHPLGFMLASPVHSTQQVVERFVHASQHTTQDTAQEVGTQPVSHAEPHPFVVEEEAYAVTPHEVVPLAALQLKAQVEDKYDGMRVQLHCGEKEHPGRVALYSRNREDVTESYPEIAEAFARLQCGPMILDGELLAWDVERLRALPFAVLAPRIGRKRVANAVRRAVPVIFMAFDLLYCDGMLMLDLPLRARRNRLQALTDQIAAQAIAPLALPHEADTGLFASMMERELEQVQRWMVAPVVDVQSQEDLEHAYTASRARGNEGIMIKSSDSLYQTGRRGLSWLKLKRELATLDVVITAAEYGHGKRAQLLSDYTFAVRGAHGALHNIGKAYSGLTDDEIAAMTEWLREHTLEEHGSVRIVEPVRVLEVAFNNIMRSERHESGFALRFPRIVRLRDDKPAAEIDTLARVEAIYQSQPDKPAEG